jgi:hypothetical protein
MEFRARCWFEESNRRILTITFCQSLIVMPMLVKVDGVGSGSGGVGSGDGEA